VIPGGSDAALKPIGSGTLCRIGIQNFHDQFRIQINLSNSDIHTEIGLFQTFVLKNYKLPPNFPLCTNSFLILGIENF
jgi:hypothetical protein